MESAILMLRSKARSCGPITPYTPYPGPCTGRSS